MTWQLYSFASVVLPTGSPLLPVGAPPAYTAGVNLPGGAYFDQEGTHHGGPKLPYELRLRVTALAASHTALETALFALTELSGLRGTLIRVLADGSTQQWCTAKLLSVPASGDVQNVRSQPLELVFQVQSYWYKATAITNTTTLNTSPKTVTLLNAGNARVTDAVITVTAGSAAITSLTIARTGYSELQYTGTIAAGKALVIDTGAWSVLNDGADAYTAEFQRTSNHIENTWFRLPRSTPSGTAFTVTIVGGSTDSTISFVYYEAWQ
jgi:hypothetical protein